MGHTLPHSRIMQITLNDQPRNLTRGASVAELVHDLGLDGRRLAVEVNGDIVPGSRHRERVLAEGDRVEIVHAIGGG